MTLVLALSYSSKWELTEAVRTIAAKTANGELSIDEIDDTTIDNHLSTSFMPDPELMIRTGGEIRLSNYLLWQIAYSELFFTKTLWPDFTVAELKEIVNDFNSRERRYGKV